MQHKKLSSFFQIHNKQNGHATMPQRREAPDGRLQEVNARAALDQVERLGMFAPALKTRALQSEKLMNTPGHAGGNRHDTKKDSFAQHDV